MIPEAIAAADVIVNGAEGTLALAETSLQARDARHAAASLRAVQRLDHAAHPAGRNGPPLRAEAGGSRQQCAQSPTEYLKLNPNGLIPVLVDDDLVLYETAAICLYLTDKYPQFNLAPAAGTAARAHFYKWLMWMTNTLQPAVIMYFYTDRYTTSQDAASIAAIKAKTQERMGAMLKQLDDHLASSGGPWMMGEQFSVLDIYAFMLGRWTRVWEGARPLRKKASNADFLASSGSVYAPHCWPARQCSALLPESNSKTQSSEREDCVPLRFAPPCREFAVGPPIAIWHRVC